MHPCQTPTVILKNCPTLLIVKTVLLVSLYNASRISKILEVEISHYLPKAIMPDYFKSHCKIFKVIVYVASMLEIFLN